MVTSNPTAPARELEAAQARAPEPEPAPVSEPVQASEPTPTPEPAPDTGRVDGVRQELVDSVKILGFNTGGGRDDSDDAQDGDQDLSEAAVLGVNDDSDGGGNDDRQPLDLSNIPRAEAKRVEVPAMDEDSRVNSKQLVDPRYRHSPYQDLSTPRNRGRGTTQRRASRR